MSVLLLGFSAPGLGQAGFEPPPVTPDPLYPNILYGADPSDAPFTPVLVFVPGLGGRATDWLAPNNDMYKAAYVFGYRTAFVTPNNNDEPNNLSIYDAAEILKTLVPVIAAHFNTNEMYMIGHSKGGVDIQAAMLDPGFASMVKGVFTISSPNSGSDLADWAFDNPAIAGPLNLLTPGVESLKIANMAAFRATADPLFENLNIPIFHHAGTVFFDNPLTVITGTILKSLLPGDSLAAKNDGFVPVGRTKLSYEFGINLGTVAANHFNTDSGSVSIPKITGRIQAIRNTIDEFQRIAINGFARWGGDANNTWAWSMAWFKGKLYVGTGRQPDCITLLTSDVRLGTSFYPPAVLSGQCPEPPVLAESLAAEIWQFDPANGQWQKVYESPQDLPVDVNGQTIMSARDIGYRGMTSHVEPNGTEALYVGGVTSGSIYDPDVNGINTFPGPRLLRSVDGVNWAPVPAPPGTYLGELGNEFVTTETKVRSFRSLQSFGGKLFASAGSFVGSGFVIASEDPAAGGNAWFRASGPWEDLPVWKLEVFNNRLYATTGFTKDEKPDGEGYGVYRTDATGPAPFNFIPVVTQGGFQTDPLVRAPNGLSMAVHNGQLYVGTNRPTELIRVNPDDTWDLLVGEPRMTPTGMKAPLSGFGIGFGSWFNGHFWRMASHQGKLFLGTWDWAIALQGLPSLFEIFDRAFTGHGGFDLYRTEDGVHWTAVTQTGMGDNNNSGLRTLRSTPAGLFFGTMRQNGGAQIYKYVGPSPKPLAAPLHLKSVSEMLSGRNTQLTWNPVPGAVRYQVYRATGKFFDELLDEIFPGASPASICAGVEAPQCESLIGAQEETEPSPIQFPFPYRLVAKVTGTFYAEPAPTGAQSIYFVRAEDSQGRLSDPSNIAGGPSKAMPEEYQQCDVDADGDVDSNDIGVIAKSFGLTPIGPTDPRDANGDGVINAVDTRACALKCTKPRCAL